MKRILIIVVVFIFTQLSCQFFEGPEPEWGPSFRMVVTQGFSGAIIDTISVDSYGNFTRWNGIYGITVICRMARTSYDSLLIYARGMDTMSRNYWGGCDDDGEFQMERWQNSTHKIVSATGCSLSGLGDPQHMAPASLRSLILFLRREGDLAFDALKPWKGVESSITLLNNRVLPGDSITLQLALINATPLQRNVPYYYLDARIEPDGYTNSRRGWWTFQFTPNEHDSSLFRFIPYERKLIPFVLGQTSSRFSSPLIPGEYHLTVSSFPLNAENLATFMVQVVEQGSPLSGMICRPHFFFDGESRMVTLGLLVRNLQPAPLSLEFRNSQQIAVDIYTYSGDTVGAQPPVYSGPTKLDGHPSTLLLQPGECDTLTYTTILDSLHIQEIRSTLRLRLLESSLSFDRTGSCGLYLPAR